MPSSTACLNCASSPCGGGKVRSTGRKPSAGFTTGNILKIKSRFEIGDLEVRLSEIEARITSLELERDERTATGGALETLLRYSRAIDTGDESGWVDCFADDGVFEVRPLVPGVEGRRVEGREALEGFAAAHTGPPAVHHKHAYLMPEIEVDGQRATATGYLVHLVDIAGKPLLQSFGRYLDTLVMDTDGAWRISERVIEVEAHVGAIH